MAASAPDLNKPCQFCLLTFPTTTLLIAHEKLHFNGELEVKSLTSCPTRCNHKYHSTSHLEKKMTGEEKQSKSYPCPHCHLAFSYKCNLNRHAKQAHPNPPKYNVCKICAKKVHSKAELEDHMLRHKTNKVFTCQICWKTYVTFGQLESHVYVDHTLKKDFGSQPSGGQHQIHIRKPKPKIKVFPKVQKKVQREIVEEIVVKKPYQCNVCDMTSDTIEEMTMHVKVHLN